jgi:hypothetical protein
MTHRTRSMLIWSDLSPFWSELRLTRFWSVFSSSLSSTDLKSDSDSESESESYNTTDGQSASLSWNKASIWGLRPDFCYCQTVADLLIWGALSDERTGLPFTIPAGPRQCSHFRVRVPWDSWPHFTVSDSRLPFSPPPTSLRVTVEVFGPAFTRVFWSELSSLLILYSVSGSEETSVYHTATGWFPRICLLGKVFISQQGVGFQESISTETCFSTRSLAMGLRITI